MLVPDEYKDTSFHYMQGPGGIAHVLHVEVIAELLPTAWVYVAPVVLLGVKPGVPRKHDENVLTRGEVRDAR